MERLRVIIEKEHDLALLLADYLRDLRLDSLNQWQVPFHSLNKEAPL